MAPSSCHRYSWGSWGNTDFVSDLPPSPFYITHDSFGIFDFLTLKPLPSYLLIHVESVVLILVILHTAEATLCLIINSCRLVMSTLINHMIRGMELQCQQCQSTSMCLMFTCNITVLTSIYMGWHISGMRLPLSSPNLAG